MNTINLPRSVVEKALKALYEADSLMEHHTNIELRRSALVELRAALEQPQDHLEQILDTVPAGWKLVPVKPTEDMLSAVAWPGCAATDWEHMLSAAPQPPVVEQPPVEQEPAIYPEEAFNMGLEAIPYYTHPQPKREPLTRQQIQQLVIAVCDKLYPQDGESYSEADSVFYGALAHVIERAHGIGGEK